MYYPSHELCEEYQRQRLHEADKARLLHQLKRSRNSSLGAKLFTKVLVGLGDFLVSSGLKLKHTARYEVQL
jgi:hypothetical protein